MSFKNNPSDLALEPGSLILVTGASGFIASHIIHEALAAGYKVRGTVRSEEKAEKTKKLYASDKYSTVIVEDMQHPEAFHDAVSGVDAVIHSASVMTFSNDPSKVVDPVVAGAKAILEACLKEKTIKRFVYTSSSSAATLPKPGKKFKIDASSWNTEVEEMLDGKTGEQEGKNFPVYALSKTKAERAVWDFVKSNKPSWIVNTVLPNSNFGKIYDAPGPTGGQILDILKGKRPSNQPQYSINVTDDARIHVAALVDKTVSNERVLAFDEPFNWNKIGNIIEKLTGKKTIEQDPSEGEDLSQVDNARGAELLQKWWGQKGYQGLEASVKQGIEGHY